MKSIYQLPFYTGWLVLMCFAWTTATMFNKQTLWISIVCGTFTLIACFAYFAYNEWHLKKLKAGAPLFLRLFELGIIIAGSGATFLVLTLHGFYLSAFLFAIVGLSCATFSGRHFGKKTAEYFSSKKD